MGNKMMHTGQRLLSLILVLVYALGLVPAISLPAQAATSNPQGLISISLVSIGADGQPRTGERVQGSLAVSCVLSKTGDGSLVPERSTPAVDVYISFEDMLTGQKLSEPVYYAIDTDYPRTTPQDDGTAWSNGDGALRLQLFGVYDNDTVIYITANTADGAHYCAASIDFKVLNEAKSGIKYARYGMQVRKIDEHPLGQYDYDEGRARGKANADASYASIGPGGNYTGLDDSSWPTCYVDVETSSLDRLIEDGRILNLAEVQEWLRKYYIPTLDGAMPATVTVSGPAYILMYNGTIDGAKTNEVKANTEYYQPYDNSHPVNRYVSWGEQTRTNDFVSLRNMTMIVPMPQDQGSITIKCYDEDTGKLMRTESVPLESRYTPFTTAESARAALWYDADAPYSRFLAALSAKISGDGPSYLSSLPANQDGLKAALHGLELDPTTYQLVEREIPDRDKLQAIHDAHQATLQAVQGTTPPDQTSLAMEIQRVAFPVPESTPELAGYSLDYGVAYESLIPAASGKAVPILRGTTGMLVSVSQLARDAEIDLYYRRAVGMSYTVQVRVDGKLQPELERTYTEKDGQPLKAGDVIEKKDVDTSAIPSAYTIDKILNAQDGEVDISAKPLVLAAPKTNVVIVDCTGAKDEFPYTVNYYVNGTLDQSVAFDPVPQDTVINKGDVDILPQYSSYTVESIQGTPLTVRDGNGLIRVYLKKPVTDTSISVNAKLYKDASYKTAVTTYHSGYGLFGEFYVQVPQWLYNYIMKGTMPQTTIYTTSMSHPQNGQAHARQKWGDRPTYIVDEYSFTLKWKDGMQKGKISENGVNFNKTYTNANAKALLNTKKCTGNTLCFNLPKNDNSYDHLQKAYIPVNTKEGSKWEVNFSFACKYREIDTSRDYTSKQCNYIKMVGIFPVRAQHTVYGIFVPGPTYVQRSPITASGKVQVTIDGNMYEDDFTGDRK